MIVLLAAAALQAAASSPASTAIPPQCLGYKEALESSEALMPGFRRSPSVPPPKITADIQRLLDLREQIALAMKASAPDFSIIERLMRDELQLRQAMAVRIGESKLSCDIAVLKEAAPARQRELLERLRPRTRAEVEEQRRTVPIAPPAPPPRPSR